MLAKLFRTHAQPTVAAEQAPSPTDLNSAQPASPEIEEFTPSANGRALEIRQLLQQINVEPELSSPPMEVKRGFLSRVIPFRKRQPAQQAPQAPLADTQERLISAFSERVQKAFDEVHKEAQEREAILNKRIQEAELARERQIRRLRLLAVPATLLALLAVGYLFYVVRIMETSMTLISHDMGQISGHIANMSQDTRTMSQNVGQLNQNIGQMNGNVGHMSRDVGNMSNTVSPMMGAMRSFWPF